MKIVRSALIVPLALAIGCGDDGGNNNNNTPDAQVTPDVGPDARSCTTVTPGALDFYRSGQGFIGWNGEVTGDLGDGNTLVYRFEFYDGIESSLSGTFDLTAGNQNNYKTCAVCVRAFGLDADGNVTKYYFQSGGSITLTEDPFTNQKVVGSLTDLQMEEVTIADDFTSTPVDGGACASFGSYAVDHDRVPNAWTCDHAAWDEGATCNCMCGLPDPDCDLDTSTVAGCTTAGDVCFNDACVTPPDNNTCADADAATAITIGTPVTGTTAGAGRNYDAGLDGSTCAGVPQPGPDVVYKLTLAQDQSITVTLSNVDASFDPGIALLGPSADPAICDASPIDTCVAGADAGFEGDDETFTYAATAGTYYIIVSSYYANGGGAFTLTVTTN